MDRRDYILRMIEQFGQFAIALRKLIVGGRVGSPEVKQQLRSMAQHAGFDLDMARVVSLDTLVLMLAPGGEIEPSRCWMCAETLYLDGLEAELSGDSELSWENYHKARALFSLVAPLGAFLVGFPEAASRIEEIDKRLAGLASLDDDGTAGRTSRRRFRARRAGCVRVGARSRGAKALGRPPTEYEENPC